MPCRLQTNSTLSQTMRDNARTTLINSDGFPIGLEIFRMWVFLPLADSVNIGTYALTLSDATGKVSGSACDFLDTPRGQLGVIRCDNTAYGVTPSSSLECILNLTVLLV
jgi:hypothetical protein